MAYQTGAATNYADMLSQVATFLGNNGWTIDSSGTGFFYAFQGNNGFQLIETAAWRLAVRHYTGWDSVTSSPIGLSGDLVLANVSEYTNSGSNDSIVYEYHVFTGDFSNTGESYVHLAYRTKPLYWEHVSFGMLNVCSGEPEAPYAAALTNYRSNGFSGSTSDPKLVNLADFIAMPFINICREHSGLYNSYNFRVKYTFDGVSSWSAPRAYQSFDDVDGKQVAFSIAPVNEWSTSWYGPYCPGIYNNPGIGAWQGALVGMPVTVFGITGSGTGVYDSVYIGSVPGVLFADCYRLEDAYSFSIGTEAYRVFPMFVRNATARVANVHTSLVGLAYRG